MKKLISLILATALLTVLCACAERVNMNNYNAMRELAAVSASNTLISHNLNY